MAPCVQASLWTITVVPALQWPPNPATVFPEGSRDDLTSAAPERLALPDAWQAGNSYVTNEWIKDPARETLLLQSCNRDFPGGPADKNPPWSLFGELRSRRCRATKPAHCDYLLGPRDATRESVHLNKRPCVPRLRQVAAKQIKTKTNTQELGKTWGPQDIPVGGMRREARPPLPSMFTYVTNTGKEQFGKKGGPKYEKSVQKPLPLFPSPGSVYVTSFRPY